MPLWPGPEVWKIENSQQKTKSWKPDVVQSHNVRLHFSLHIENSLFLAT